MNRISTPRLGLILVFLLTATSAFAQWVPDIAGNINYPNGKVGVGNAGPLQRLSVGGSMEVSDVAPGAVELSSNGVDWPSSNGTTGDLWTASAYTAGGGSLTLVPSIITNANGFTGRAQRLEYTNVTAPAGGKLSQAITFVQYRSYRITFRYRSSTTFQVVLGDNEGGTILPANQSAPQLVTMFTGPVIQNRPALDFYLGGGGSTPPNNGWFELDDVSVKEATAGNAIVRGMVGVGTGAPADLMHVSAPSNANMRLTHTDATSPVSMIGFYENATLYGFINQRGSTFAGTPRQFNIGNNAADGDLSLWAGSAERIHVLSGGNVGLNTNVPATLLDVNGAATVRGGLSVNSSLTMTLPGVGNLLNLRANNGNSQVLTLDHSVLTAFVSLHLLDGGGGSRIFLPAYVGNAYFNHIGNIGIGVTTPTSKLANTATNVLDASGTGVNAGAITWRTNAQGYAMAARNDSNSVALSNGLLVSIAATDVNSNALSVDSGAASRFAVRADGQVRIGGEPVGTLASDKLVVNGTIRGANIIATYQDVAEWVPTTEHLEAGNVVVVARGAENTVVRSVTSYDTRVAGVVSAQPGLTLGVPGDSKAMIATTGRVKVRVDATRAPIEAGDLLVTSDIPGMAMRSEPVDLGGVKIHRPGTLIGKALEPLRSGQGEILVLLSMQ